MLSHKYTSKLNKYEQYYLKNYIQIRVNKLVITYFFFFKLDRFLRVLNYKYIINSVNFVNIGYTFRSI